MGRTPITEKIAEKQGKAAENVTIADVLNELQAVRRRVEALDHAAGRPLHPDDEKKAAKAATKNEG